MNLPAVLHYPLPICLKSSKNNFGVVAKGTVIGFVHFAYGNRELDAKQIMFRNTAGRIKIKIKNLNLNYKNKARFKILCTIRNPCTHQGLPNHTAFMRRYL